MDQYQSVDEDCYRQYKAPPTPAVKRTTEQQKSEFSTAISWPILLAIIPTLGAFVAGSAEVWSDFIMILLILYYVYKWITVPWSYYESAKSRRIIHQYKKTSLHKEFIQKELKRHELVGLIWVVMSPAIAGYTLQYSRYFLSNYDKYMSTFNVTVFVLAATLKPLIHVMALLRERTMFLQSEMQMDETQVEILQRRLELMQEELENLRKAFATKRDLGQMAQGITPSIHQLSKAIKRFEKKESALRTWSEGKFTDIDHKVQSFDQFICYSIDQDQHKSAQRLFVALVLLPINLTFWAAKRIMTIMLPISKAPSPGLPSRPSKHLMHTDLTGVVPRNESSSEQVSRHKSSQDVSRRKSRS